MSEGSDREQGVRRGARPARRRNTLMILSVLGFTLVGIVGVLESYLSFRYPIKWDRYRHSFSEHVVDRATAYALLFRSSFRSRNRGMPAESVQKIVDQISNTYGVDRCLVTAVVIFESGFNPNTITTTGAIGLMALQPRTADIFTVQDPFDPQQNVDGGTRLLRDLLDSFGGDVTLVLAAYNAGPNAVKRYGGVPPYRETQDYVSHVGRIYDLCRAQPALFSMAAIAAGPPDAAKGDPSLWPQPVRTRAEFDSASRCLILTYIAAQAEVLAAPVNPGDLGVPAINEASLARWKEREESFWLRTFLDSTKTCALAAPGCDFRGRTFPELLVYARQLRLPEEFSPWLAMARDFSLRYAHEQMRLAALFPAPSSEILPFTEDEILGDEFPDGEFLFTMDDGPAADTGKYAKLLESHRVSAFFFALGTSLEAAIARSTPAGTAAVYGGHCLASHGYEHVSHQTWAEWENSHVKTATLVRNVFPGSDAVHFRPPYGHRDEALLANLESHGAKSILWSIDSQDWNHGFTATEVSERVTMLVLLRRKGVILFHDVHPKAFTAIPALDALFRSADLRWVDCKGL